MFLANDTEYSKWDVKFKLILVIFILFLLYNFFSFDETTLDYVGMEPFGEPVQENITEKLAFQQNFRGGLAYIVPLQKYRIYGRVLEKHYVPAKLHLASVVPYDVTLVWGECAKKDVFKKIKTAMSGRVVYYSTSRDLDYLSKDVGLMLSNNHLIPANKKVRSGISKLKKKDIVYMEGYLAKVSIHKNSGIDESYESSLTREDTGLGACELMYVTKLVSRYGRYK